MRHVNTKDVFLEKWITQNTRAQPKIQSGWWKAKEKYCIKAAFHHQAGRRAFKTSTQLPLNKGVWFPLKVSPVVRTGLRAVLCPNLHKASHYHERETVSNSKFLCSQKHTQLWSSLLQVITKAWEIQLKSNCFWFIINKNNVQLQKMQSRLLTAEALGKKRWSSYNILKLIPYISAF